MSTIQIAQAVLMVCPTSFGFNEQTAVTNTFQNQPTVSQAVLQQHAYQEFATMVDELRRRGVQVIVFEDQDKTSLKPDAVFPNNWLSTWPDGSIFLYPMANESRRIERSANVIQEIAQDFNIEKVIDTTDSEERGSYLEGTGAIVFDHANKIAYGCISPRCDANLFTSHVLNLGYRPILFHAYDKTGTAIYHTNVLLAVQSTTAVICTEAITDSSERKQVLKALTNTGHIIIDVTQDQMIAFCANALELRNKDGEHFLAMSQTALTAFSDEQLELLGKDKTLLPFKIPTIETVGGGSVRCTLAEIFLPIRTTVQADRILPSLSVTSAQTA